MDDLFREMDCGSKSDAIVMRLLRSAMDKAHENVQSHNGPIEFLHKRSKFYELAAILVNGGLGIVQEETEIVETNRQQMLSDLREIKDWLQRRIEEMHVLIVEKDKELLEREENELKLRHELDMNVRELASLQEKLEFERLKTHELDDFVPSNQESEDESQDGGDICELKNSVDQQVLNIKQKLEGEHKSSTRRRRASISCASDNELYYQLLENSRNSGSEFMENVDLLNHFPGIKPPSSSLKPGKNNAMSQQMKSDIDILKGTLDLAFGRMQNAEAFPLEKQWKWSIEKDTTLVSLKGFLNDIQRQCLAEIVKRDCLFLSGEKRKEFTDEMRTLRDQLKALISPIKVEEKRSDMQEVPAPQSSLDRTTSEPLPDVFFKQEDKNSDPSGSHFVAKMVKNHESFIHKQRVKEGSWLREIRQRKGESSSATRDKDPDELECRIQKVILVLESLIKLDDILREDEKFRDKKIILEEDVAKLERSATENKNSARETDFCHEIRKLKQERDDAELQNFIIQEIYLLVFRDLSKNLQVGVCAHEQENRCKAKEGNFEEETELNFLMHYLESSTREDVYKVYFRETIWEWKMQMDCIANDSLLEQEIASPKATKCIEPKCNLVISRLKMEIEDSEPSTANLSCSSMLPETAGSSAGYFREFFNEWRTERDAQEVETLIREDIYQFVMVEMMKEFHASAGQSETSERRRFSDCFASSADWDVPSESDLIERFNSVSRHYQEEGMVCSFSQTEVQSEQCDEYSYQVRCQPEPNEIPRQSPSVLSAMMEFQQTFMDFEQMGHKKLELSSSRLVRLKTEVNESAQHAAALREKKLLYKKAFITRCQNLRLAETEVDLLGNQVDKLVCLLHNIYITLHQNSAILSHTFGVFDILKWIEKELKEGAACMPACLS